MEVWGGAVPDSVMRYLGENPWDRLEIIKEKIGNSSKLSALSRGRNLFGYNPYPDEIIEGFCRNSIRSGIDIMRIFDALNDVDNVKSTIRYVKKFGGKADCAICYTIDPHHSPVERIKAALHGRPLHKPVFTNEYFLNKALQLESLGADMITLKDMSGLIPPARTAELVRLFKKSLKVPVDFHTHCTPGYGLASVVSAIINGVDIVDTNIWNFAGGPAAPAVELPECTDDNAVRITAFLTGLLEHMDSPAAVKVYEEEKGRYKVILEGQKLGALIGRRGETLDAIQQLTNYAVNSGSEKRIRVHVDAENYRARREASLESLAMKVAGKVKKYRRSVTLEAMNAYERHVIHAALQDVKGVTTYSVGTEPNRRVVVAYDRGENN